MVMANIYYNHTDEFWRKQQKYDFLEAKQYQANIAWQEIQPNKKFTWLTEGLQIDFETFLALGDKSSKSPADAQAVFWTFSNGVKTNNDSYVCNFDNKSLIRTAQRMVENYNNEKDRWIRSGQPKEVSKILKVDEQVLKWIRNTKRNLLRGTDVTFDIEKIRSTTYRPFCRKYYYFEKVFNEDIYRFPLIFPTPAAENENLVICVPSRGGRAPFWSFCSASIINLSLTSIDATQCFPFYTYDEDGSNRRENITAWALEQYQAQYQDTTISKWDIFHYVYALLHHPTYRDTYAANLRWELPRIPFVSNFWGFAQAGARLAEIHVNYEQQPEYPLQFIETPGEPLNWRVEKMRLSKDKSQLKYNDFLTLAGIPPQVFDYRLGNRSALEWIIDQYQVKTDKRSGIVNDPNNLDDEQYIVRLIGQVITVSLETVELVQGLPAWEIVGESG